MEPYRPFSARSPSAFDWGLYIFRRLSLGFVLGVALGCGGGPEGYDQDALDAFGADGTYAEPGIDPDYAGSLRGELTYSLPLEVPVGPAGLKLPVVLRYSSGSVNAKSGMRTGDGADVGVGWTLALGHIDQDASGQASITMDGLSGTMFPAASWNWKAGAASGVSGWSTERAKVSKYELRNASFQRILQYHRDWKNGAACACDGSNGCAAPNKVAGRIRRDGYWEVTNQSGTKYFFGKRVGYDEGSGAKKAPWNQFAQNDYGVGHGSRAYAVRVPAGQGPAHRDLEFRRWHLDRVVDAHGNELRVNYDTYASDEVVGSDTCSEISDFAWKESYPSSIRYNLNNRSGAKDSHAEYEIRFIREEKAVDNLSELQLSQSGHKLVRVEVWYTPAPGEAAELMRAYRFTYDETELASSYVHTLRTVEEFGLGGVPGGELRERTTLSYDSLEVKGPEDGSTRARMFLASVENRRGGKTSFSYEPFSWSGDSQFKDRTIQRLRSKVVHAGDCGGGECSLDRLTTYLYGAAKFHREKTPGKIFNSVNGFAYVVAEGPAALGTAGNLKVRTDYHVEDGNPYDIRNAKRSLELLGRPKQKSVFDSGEKRSETLFSYNIVKDFRGVPKIGGKPLSRFVHVSKLVQRDFGENGKSIHRRAQTFAAKAADQNYGQGDQNFHYGRVTEIREFAGEDTSGTPLRSVKRIYCVNRGAYQVRLCVENVKAGDLSGNDLVAQTLYPHGPSASDAAWNKRPNARGLLRGVRVRAGPGQYLDTRYFYDAWGNRTEVRSFNNQATPSTALGSATAWASGGARRAITAYDGVHHSFPVRLTNAEGHSVQTLYYGVGAGPSSSVSGGYPGLPAAVFQRQDGQSRPTDRATRFAYDAFGRRSHTWYGVRSDDVAGRFDSAHEVVAYDDATGRVYTQTRVDTGAVTAAGTYNHRFRFLDGLGRTVQAQVQWSATDADTKQVQIVNQRYDRAGRLRAVTTPIRRTAWGEFHASFRDWDLPKQLTEYDALGRVKKEVGPDGVATEYVYNNNTRGVLRLGPVNVANNTRHAIKRTVDAFGRVVQVNESKSTDGGQSFSGYSVTKHSYDALDRRTHTVHPGPGNKTSRWVYDFLGRVSWARDPDRGRTDYAYDTVGNVIKRTDAAEGSLCYRHDGLDRLRTVDFGCDGTVNVSHLYDRGVPGQNDGNGWALGQRYRSTVDEDGDGNVEVDDRFGFDRRGRVARWDRAFPGHQAAYGLSGYRSIRYGYDHAGRPRSVVYPDGETVHTDYTGAGMPWRLRRGDNSLFVKRSVYNERGQLTERAFGNDLVEQRVYYGSGQRFRLNRLQLGPANAPRQVVDLTHSYDRLGQIRSVTDALGPEGALQERNYDYDFKGRLTSAVATGVAGRYNLGYRYDAADRMTARRVGNAWVNHRFAAGHHHATIGDEGKAQSYFYSAEGNMHRRVRNGETYLQDWSEDDRLIRVVGPSGSADYWYDADRALAILHRSADNRAHLSMGKLWERQPDGVVKRYFLGDTLVAERRSGTLRYAHTDRLGSVIALTNGNRTVASMRRYRPFGANAYTGGAKQGAPHSDLGFTGERGMEDASGGLIVMGARVYAPDARQWLSPDRILPSDAPGDLNRYAYVNQNPVSFADPSGYKAVDPTEGGYDPDPFDDPVASGAEAYAQQSFERAHFARMNALAAQSGADRSYWGSLSDAFAAEAQNQLLLGWVPSGFHVPATRTPEEAFYDFLREAGTDILLAAAIRPDAIRSRVGESARLRKMAAKLSARPEEQKAVRFIEQDLFETGGAQVEISKATSAGRGIMEARRGNGTQARVYYYRTTETVMRNGREVDLDTIVIVGKDFQKQGKGGQNKVMRVIRDAFPPHLR